MNPRDLDQLQANIATLNMFLLLLAFCVHEIYCFANRRWWVRTVFSEEQRRNHGSFYHLHNFLRIEDHEMFFRLFHMEECDFSLLYEKLRDKLRKKDTRLRKSLPAELRLAAILR